MMIIDQSGPARQLLTTVFRSVLRQDASVSRCRQCCGNRAARNLSLPFQTKTAVTFLKPIVCQQMPEKYSEVTGEEGVAICQCIMLKGSSAPKGQKRVARG
jgi:hypothetical protein